MDSKARVWLWRGFEFCRISNRPRRGRRRDTAGVAAILGAIAMLAAATAQAATTITVNTLNDDPAGATGQCTLRDAINSAQGGAAVAGSSCNYAVDTAYVIVFASGLSGSISLGATLPLVTGDLTIQGPGVTIDGSYLYQAIQVAPGASLTLDSLTIEDASGEYGGGILNEGTLAVNNCTFDTNAGAYGGAICNTGGTVTVSESTFLNNSGGNGGGSIANIPGGGSTGALIVLDSTFDGNTTSGDGAAIYNDDSGGLGATATVTNCTFSGNTAIDMGGSIYNFHGDGIGATATVTASTFSGNSASNGGGGIYNSDGTVNVKSTILASSTGGNCAVAPSGGAIGDAGYNISDDTSCGFAGDGVNPLLDTAGLTDNGGPTYTIALQSTSPALDAIPVADCTDQSGNAIITDQRGEPRPDNNEAECDIGAFEYQDTGISFSGTPGTQSCVKDSVSELDAEYGSIKAAASYLGYPNPGALRADIRAYCGG